MGFKINNRIATDIVNGKPKQAYNDELNRLINELKSAKLEDVYKLQGKIEMLEEVIKLPDKAKTLLT